MNPDPADVVVLHRDAHLLVVTKPVGIATTAPDDGPCLFSWVRALDPQAPQLHPLSRLDTQVSGIVAFARTAAANHAVLEARRVGSFGRRYLALAVRAPEPPDGRWSFAIGLNPRDPKKRVAVAAGARGVGVKEASTRYAVRAQAGPLVALDLWPETGRTHQLRVHASHAGLPLFGDVAYGGDKRLTLPNGRILTGTRVMLHCASLRVPKLLPELEALAFELAPPPDMLAPWRAAGGDPTQLGA